LHGRTSEAPCIVFGANQIKLSLNGHTITGPVDPPTNCSLRTDSTFGVGVFVNGHTDVAIDGPGVIQKFQRWGIFLLSGTRVTVNKVTVNRNFFNTASDNVVRNNTIAGNPPGQVAKTFVLSNQQGADIDFQSNFTGANNTVEDNFCLTFIGSGTPLCPNIPEHADQ
jgi:hypothetical protein